MPKDPTSDKLKARMQQWQSYVEQPVTDSDTFSVAKIAAARGSEKTASPRLLTGAVVSSDIVILRRNRSESSTVGATRVEVIHTAPLYDAEGRLLKPALAVPTFASAAGNTPRPSAPRNGACRLWCHCGGGCSLHRSALCYSGVPSGGKFRRDRHAGRFRVRNGAGRFVGVGAYWGRRDPFLHDQQHLAANGGGVCRGCAANHLIGKGMVVLGPGGTRVERADRSPFDFRLRHAHIAINLRLEHLVAEPLPNHAGNGAVQAGSTLIQGEQNPQQFDLKMVLAGKAMNHLVQRVHARERIHTRLGRDQQIVAGNNGVLGQQSQRRRAVDQHPI